MSSSKIKSIVAAVLLSMASAGHATTVQFEDVNFDTLGGYGEALDLREAGSTVSGGYRFTANAEASAAAVLRINAGPYGQIPWNGTNNLVFAGSGFTLSNDATTPFSVTSFGLASIEGDDLTLTGMKADGTSITWTGAAHALDPYVEDDFVTINLAGFTNLTSLAFSGGSYANLYVDNIVVNNYVAAPVPEPETYGMLLAGLGMIGYIARRRKALAVPSRLFINPFYK